MGLAGLDAAGEQVSGWWPIGYALGRLHEERAIPALRILVAGEGRYTRGFAARGLGALKDRDAFDLLKTVAADVGREPGPAVEAVGRPGGVPGPPALPGRGSPAKTPARNPAHAPEAARAP